MSTSMKKLLIFIYFMNSTLLKNDTRRLQFHIVERNVEFVLAPQHETSYDSEIPAKEDFKSKFRKQLESSPTTIK